MCIPKGKRYFVTPIIPLTRILGKGKRLKNRNLKESSRARYTSEMFAAKSIFLRLFGGSLVPLKRVVKPLVRISGEPRKKANAIRERFWRSVRRECLEHMLVWGGGICIA